MSHCSPNGTGTRWRYRRAAHVVHVRHDGLVNQFGRVLPGEEVGVGPVVIVHDVVLQKGVAESVGDHLSIFGACQGIVQAHIKSRGSGNLYTVDIG